VVSIFLGGTVGLTAWGTIAVSVAALVRVKSETRRWMAWAGLCLGVTFRS
jgi:hypothetical protein